MIPLRLSVLALLASFVSCEQQVLSNVEVTEAEGALRRFSGEVRQVLAAAQEYDLDVWHATSEVVDIYSPPDAPFLPEVLARRPHNTTYIAPFSQSSSYSTSELGWNITTLEDTPFHDSYHPLNDTYSFLRELSAKYSDIMSLESIGTSAEGRDIMGLKISLSPGPAGNKEDSLKRKKKPRANEGEKLAFVIVGAQHAREWVATATAIYLSHAIVANRTESYSLHNLLTHFDFHIIPIPNPDGYAYTWETDRYWYKNRQVISPYTKCVGLDMNRNWGYKWSGAAVDGRYLKEDDVLTKAERKKKSKKDKNETDKAGKPPIANPCSHWYPGSRAFESPEVNAIANYVATIPNLVGFVGLRSYGQMLSSPYSYSCNRLPKDAEDQIEAALGASHEVSSVHSIPYAVGSLCANLYAAPGNILDWMYAREAVKYAYVAHLRDTGTYGFSLPEKWLRPTAEESTGLVDYLGRFIAKQSKSTS